MKDQGQFTCMNKHACCSMLAVTKPVTHKNTSTHTQDHGHLRCRCVLGRDATRLSRFCHSGGVEQCLRLLQSLSQRAHKAVPYGLGQCPPPPTALSAENCGGSNFITFCLIHPRSLTYSLHFSLSLFLLPKARYFKRTAPIYFDNLVFFHLHLADSHLGRLAVQVQQLTKLAFADCQHHTLPLVKTFEDQSCGALTMA